MSSYSVADMIFQKFDSDSNGRISKDEIDKWFNDVGDGFDFLTMEDLRNGLQIKE